MTAYQEPPQRGTLAGRSLQPIQGEKDTYELKIDITRDVGRRQILAQTGLEIAFAQGGNLFARI